MAPEYCGGVIGMFRPQKGQSNRYVIPKADLGGDELMDVEGDDNGSEEIKEGMRSHVHPVQICDS